MTKKLLPAPGYVLIKPLEEEKTTASGIVLPDSHEEKPSVGKIVAVGDNLVSKSGKKISAWKEIKKGAIVIYKKWSGSEYRPKGEGKDFLFVKFGDILALTA